MATEEKSIFTISPVHPSFLMSSPKEEFPDPRIKTRHFSREGKNGGFVLKKCAGSLLT
jgi:hypothetical protein